MRRDVGRAEALTTCDEIVLLIVGRGTVITTITTVIIEGGSVIMDTNNRIMGI